MKFNLLIPEKPLFFLALFGALFSFFTISFDLTNLGIPPVAGNFLMYMALFCNFITAVVLIIDIFKNNISGKYLWTLGLLFFGGIAGIIYLRRRDEILIKS